MKSWLLTVFLIAFAVPKVASADIIFTIDMDPVAAAVQTSLTVNTGQTFTVDLLMQVTGTTVLQGYGLTTQFDTVELNPNFGASGRFRPANWLSLGTFAVEDPIGLNNPNIDAATGQFINIAAGSGDVADDVAAPSSFVIASLSFTAGSNGNSDGIVDILPGFFSPQDGRAGSNLGVTVFQGGTVNINAVPEPSALFLGALSVGLVLAIRRRKQCTIGG